FILRIGQVDGLTELFNLNDFGLSNLRFTFTPDGSTNFYSVCREPVSSFSTDPTGGILVSLGDDAFVKVVVPLPVSLFGKSTNELFIGANGYITFNSGDTSHSENFNTHFALPRISALFRDLVPKAHSVSWKALGDRVAITYQDIPEYGTSRTNNFQVEMFVDGRISITYLQMETRNGLVGLSRGTGVPAAFMESDFNHYLGCGPALVVSLPSYASEEDGMLFDAGRVSIPAPLSSNLIIRLFSSDSTQATVPAEVLLLAGQTNAWFDLTVVDDEFYDGSQPVTVTAMAEGFQLGRTTIMIHDNEAASLLVSLPGTASENAGVINGTVQIDDIAAAADIVVSLESSDPWKLQVPSSVVIPAGQGSASFQCTIINNSEIDGDSMVAVTASVVGWNEGHAYITILDDEDRNLRLRLPTIAREGNGVLPNAASVHISGEWPEDLVVGLNSSVPNKLSLPSFITIPAGQTFTTFNLTVIDNAELDGGTMVQITANAGEFISDQKTLTVTDDETPLPLSNPHPAHLATNVTRTTQLQ
ncbi:MAG: hypothetical protein ACK4UN_19640, partial [Limisphaerales bacterium]